MSLDRKQLKAEAKDRLARAKVNPYGFTLVYLIVSAVLGALSFYTSAPRIVESIDQLQIPELSLEIRNSLYISFFSKLPALPSGSAAFIGILVWLVAVLLQAGVVLYHLGVFRGEERPFSTLFEGFGIAGKVIVLALLESIFVFLWSLLFVIPGIIAVYRYRFALYSLCEDPEMRSSDALRRSKQLTRGFKWRLFVLDLSFLGWDLLSGLTGHILDIWLDPYKSQTDMGYYHAIKAIQDGDTPAAE